MLEDTIKASKRRKGVLLAFEAGGTFYGEEEEVNLKLKRLLQVLDYVIVITSPPDAQYSPLLRAEWSGHKTYETVSAVLIPVGPTRFSQRLTVSMGSAFSCWSFSVGVSKQSSGICMLMLCSAAEPQDRETNKWEERSKCLSFHHRSRLLILRSILP